MCLDSIIRKITKKQLNEILEKHRLWLEDEQNGERADLTGADLTGANLTGVNLAGANLTGADLFRADLTGANLSRADLTGANLSRADLFRANLSRADLFRANLTGADLTGVDLTGVDLSRADLFRANLTGSNLMSTRLDGSHVAGTEGVLSVSTQNPYVMFAFMEDGELLITAGCRRGLKIEEAREHWAPENQKKWTKKTKEYGEIYLRAVDYLEAEAKALGWIDDE